uniref:Large ribosomal subunit protein uL18m n=1 Tax=Reclinomonas americana TaxID=48483 RepID=RM18_RECAM|nr:ribosomal protein L18 [Reclinomonas americana]O21256.1 RecName: Full=Large ribosomal subunit protein uL18m; AltName: Full=60S ribosomal protein L18, mitochondrial [Reclinomonas americana]AAD11883.1 ribosomal protein L18 [Reclinomonas americana]
MDHKLYLRIKKTNQHLYAYVLYKGKQLVTVSTNQKIIRNDINKVNKKIYPEILGYLLSDKIKEFGFLNIYLKRTYLFHGKVKTIVDVLRKNGVVIY